MSNPQEKAKELFDKYCLALKTEGDEFGCWTNVIYAKQCALIAVDEILLAIDWHEFEYPNDEFEYWHEVKAEIEKL